MTPSFSPTMPFSAWSTTSSGSKAWGRLRVRAAELQYAVDPGPDSDGAIESHADRYRERRSRAESRLSGRDSRAGTGTQRDRTHDPGDNARALDGGERLRGHDREGPSERLHGQTERYRQARCGSPS